MCNTEGLVSIIMPAYNASRFIKDSILSVMSQTYSDWELIIVNDHSTDDTKDIVESFSRLDNRIQLLHNQETSRGAYFARNLGLRNAKGRFICFLDSDDKWLPEKLDRQLEIMISEGYSVCHAGYFRITESDTLINSVTVLEKVTYHEQLKSNRIPNLTGIYDSQKIPIIEQKNIGHEDYNMWLDILKKSPSIGIKEPLAYYRVVDNSLSSNKFKAARWHYSILRSQKEIGLIRRGFYFFSYVYYALRKRF
ncbi:glycosyltransferase family 2 protein [Vibrio parahaemolyticus]|nr:glycosyltransferase family 2 protein [Vibrio parahaemolyticus]MDG2608956.1 glycosyltransferase family 2 protein [Vibrio parahaemolyticus]MDG2683793.1 glycosyltransferase family 2 protein [Vibrio parahaemolyticus]HDM8138697.1 glycosyltransferase family 2 protein [Vibrio harveyi]HDM8168143.1 glycosyltransferase family 2 protein [Vibrio harveyi]